MNQGFFWNSPIDEKWERLKGKREQRVFSNQRRDISSQWVRQGHRERSFRGGWEGIQAENLDLKSLALDSPIHPVR